MYEFFPQARRLRTVRTLHASLAPALLVACLCAPAAAQVTQRVSVDGSSAQGNSDSLQPAISSGGRYVVFAGTASNLVPGDTNGTWDVFVRDRIAGTTALVSVSTAGVQANNFCEEPSISADGRYVVFWTDATNLVLGDVNAHTDVFLRDLQAGTTAIASYSSSGAQGNGGSRHAVISGDGHRVAFLSDATNFAAADTNNQWDVFVRDLVADTTERVNVSSTGTQTDFTTDDTPAISADGRYVAFDTLATTLVPGDTNASVDIFVRDMLTGTTTRASVDSSGAQANANSFYPSISADGRYVAFRSHASNLVPGDTNGWADIFVHDMVTGATTRVSVDSSGAQGTMGLSDTASISADGRYVAFSSGAHGLVPGDTNGYADVFLHDMVTGVTSRLNVTSSGMQVDFGDSFWPAISPDGRFVAFASRATNLVPNDTNLSGDVFVHDVGSSGFTSLCDPGIGGVIACPCSNAPSGPGRGCDNSSSTGGATLAASGIAYLSMDSLVFTTSGEKPTATSILLQGTSVVSSGAVYGQGVRCTGGTLLRLYTKPASGGSITAPDLAGGDPTLSARSAAKGDPISPGQSRWYLVYYRDPTVLGSCAPGTTFNATQTGRIDWSL